MRMNCPKCGRPGYADDDRYCYADGTALVETTKCGACGRNLDPMDEFCPRCGVKLREKGRKKSESTSTEKTV